MAELTITALEPEKVADKFRLEFKVVAVATPDSIMDTDPHMKYNSEGIKAGAAKMFADFQTNTPSDVVSFDITISPVED